MLSYPVGVKIIDKNEYELAGESRSWLVGTKESRYDGEKRHPGRQESLIKEQRGGNEIHCHLYLQRTVVGAVSTHRKSQPGKRSKSTTVFAEGN